MEINYNDVNSKLNDIIGPFLHNERSISVNDHLLNDLGIDSMDMVDIVVKIEDCFSIKLIDHEVYELSTFGSLTRLVQEKIKENGKRDFTSNSAH